MPNQHHRSIKTLCFYSIAALYPPVHARGFLTPFSVLCVYIQENYTLVR